MSDDIVLGAKQIKNPKGIKVSSDTDNPGLPKHHAPMDISNPSTADVIPKHPVEELFMNGIKRSSGRMVPKDHPALQVSEN